MNSLKTSIEGKKGGIIGALIGGLLALVIIWHKRYISSEILSATIIIGLPWGSASLGSYIQRRYAGNKDTR